ncbi:carotenoid oxygenase family protein [Streptomyces sp. NPDC005820]|uniref:carotenoid oxygenase family protein n=1 Tax=Streptomyces sp. NPDC005820 TaxID=3157069 RepID=UPI0033CEAA26
MSRTHGSTDVRRYDIDDCYVCHVGNAYEDAHGRIVLDAVRHDPAGFRHAWSGTGGAAGPAAAKEPSRPRTPSLLHRWTLDPAAGRVTETRLDDREAEFPHPQRGPRRAHPPLPVHGLRRRHRQARPHGRYQPPAQDARRPPCQRGRGLAAVPAGFHGNWLPEPP